MQIHLLVNVKEILTPVCRFQHKLVFNIQRASRSALYIFIYVAEVKWNPLVNPSF